MPRPDRHAPIVVHVAYCQTCGVDRVYGIKVHGLRIEYVQLAGCTCPLEPPEESRPPQP